ncbi:MAG: hypothetical protein JNN21_11825 [Candidatus Accumulibacter sp.]|uniref:hypothetical protein n=1 Tax=Accumulibacter sp. TaxID=2053492 RepID=UPI001A55251A|nr:hypothetical protein [Accumulibacter sp.]MBL8392542.1 hypothetical protein [Accumulibacter sp.]HRD87702.1 hypothetical protein [Accumulibacter sp.]
MKKNLVAAAMVAVLSVALTSASAAVVRSDFSLDADAEGWGPGRISFSGSLPAVDGAFTGDDQGNDDSRLDNVCLRDVGSSCPVGIIPEPAALALFGLATGLLGPSRSDSRPPGRRQR